MLSLKYHGYRLTSRRTHLKKKKGYVIPSTKKEDGSGVDFWVKPPGVTQLYPVQITQRGVRIFREWYKNHTPEQLADFIVRSNRRIKRKRTMCRRCNIVFVLVRDHIRGNVSRSLAWSDVKALRYALKRIKN